MLPWQAKQLWEEDYGLGSFEPPGGGAEGSHRPDPPPTAARAPPTQHAADSKITYDLIAAAARQKVFLYQVSLFCRCRKPMQYLKVLLQFRALTWVRPNWKNPILSANFLRENLVQSYLVKRDAKIWSDSPAYSKLPLNHRDLYGDRVRLAMKCPA
jgi:hypothetical protein